MKGNREAVLAAIEAAAGPSSAADIVRGLEGRCDPATVYRALHRLEGEGRLEAFVFECEERGIERYYLSRSSAHRHYFHCERCHRFIDLGECRLGELVGELERERGFRVEGHTLYFTGTCPECSTDRRLSES
jgi:Fur family ferric uptake transcriptional regulator